jgi:hypothetical protein
VNLTYISVTIGVAIAVWCAWYCRHLAAAKGRNVLVWSVLGFVLTVVAVPVLVLLPLAPDEREGAGGVTGVASAEHAQESAAPD